MEKFGVNGLRQRIALFVVFVLALIALIVVEAAGYAHIFLAIHASIVASYEAAIAVIAGLVGAVAAIVPLLKLAFASNQESSVSGGDVIFKQASTIKDKLGFLSTVKQELQLLFDYLHDFDPRIILVPIVDDLDRCITDGRNVKILEAMQLILSVPGAPIMSFLAVDSRIVVASIEDFLSKVIAHTNISGWEYLDKIVQLPFSLPEPPPEKVERLLSKLLEGDAATPVQVARRLNAFGTHSRRLLDAVNAFNASKQATFEVTPTKDSQGLLVDLEPLVLAIEEYTGSDVQEVFELKSEKGALKLVRAAAKELGPYLKKLAGRTMDEEAVEVLCRETNAALETGSIGLKEGDAGRTAAQETDAPPAPIENGVPLVSLVSLESCLKGDPIQSADEVVLPLINAITAKTVWEDGTLPLHWAVQNQASEAVVIALLDAYPEGANETMVKPNLLNLSLRSLPQPRSSAYRAPAHRHRMACHRSLACSHTHAHGRVSRLPLPCAATGNGYTGNGCTATTGNGCAGAGVGAGGDCAAERAPEGVSLPPQLFARIRIQRVPLAASSVLSTGNYHCIGP